MEINVRHDGKKGNRTLKIITNHCVADSSITILASLPTEYQCIVSILVGKGGFYSSEVELSTFNGKAAGSNPVGINMARSI